MIIIERACPGNSHVLTGESFKNLLLWRPRIGEAFTVCNEDKRFFRGRVVRLEHDMAEVLIFEEFDGPVESEIEITLLQALPEKERMELIIQKTTELGVSSIIPFKSRRSIGIEERDARQRKSHRWGEIALKAARQSRRAIIPEVHPYCSFNNALNVASPDGLKLIVWENEKRVRIKDAIRGIRDLKRVAVMIGPEGGFEQIEIEEAKTAGFVPVGLGGRILRTETAAIIMVGLIQYETGNM